MQAKNVDQLFFCLENITEITFDSETGASRVHQMGILSAIYVLQNKGYEVTSRLIAEKFSYPISAVNNHLRKLERKKLIERTRVINKNAKGIIYSIKVIDREDNTDLNIISK